MSGRITRASLFALAVFACVQAVAVPLAATISNPVPEIDGSSLSAGMALLAAGVLVVRARRREK